MQSLTSYRGNLNNNIFKKEEEMMESHYLFSETFMWLDFQLFVCLFLFVKKSVKTKGVRTSGSTVERLG